MTRFGQTVVAGAGIGGLAAAAALAPVSKRVLVVDRDDVPDLATGRRGVPHGDHLHNLLGRAQQELERILPSILAELRARGCAEASVADETHVFEFGRRMPERPLGLRLLSVRHPVIEHVASEIVRRLPNIELLDATAVEGLELDASGAIAGVRLLSRGSRRILPCDAVVDATGAAAASASWMSDAGRSAPTITTRHTRRWYATSMVDRAPMQHDDPSFCLTFATPPATRTGLVSPLGPTHWWVSVSGDVDDPVPETYEDLLTFTRTLEDDRMAAQLELAGGGSRPRRYHRHVARWRRYEAIGDPIKNLFPIGDAVAALDPIYGQGLSVASWQATSLRDLAVATVGAGDLTIAYLQAAASAVEAAWDVGNLVDDCDTSLAGLNGPVSLGDLVCSSPDVHRTYVEIWHLLRPVGDLRRVAERALVSPGTDFSR